MRPLTRAAPLLLQYNAALASGDLYRASSVTGLRPAQGSEVRSLRSQRLNGALRLNSTHRWLLTPA